MQRLLIGTYPVGDEAGAGEGIWQVDLDTATGALGTAQLLVELPSPSFLALHPSGRSVLAVSETVDGRLTSLAVGADGSLAVRSTLPTQGDHPCHVVAGDGTAFVANYSSGTFVAFGLDGDGALTGASEAFAHEGSGPDAGRQEGPHAHFCLPTGEGQWGVDLGTDQVRRFRADADAVAGLVDAGIAATLPPGTGPRHAVVHPSGVVLVVGELDSQVHTLRVDQTTGTAEAVAAEPACVTPEVGTGSYPSHVALSADGTRLYVAVRGPDVLATFDVSADGGLTHLADTPLGGVWPRHFAVVAGETGDLVVVANQTSSNLAVLRVDAVTGAGEVVASQPFPVPACVLPV